MWCGPCFIRSQSYNNALPTVITIIILLSYIHIYTFVFSYSYIYHQIVFNIRWDYTTLAHKVHPLPPDASQHHDRLGCCFLGLRQALCSERNTSPPYPPPPRNGVVFDWMSFWGFYVHMTGLRVRFLVWLCHFKMTSHAWGLLSVLRITTFKKNYGMVITHTKTLPQNNYF